MSRYSQGAIYHTIPSHGGAEKYTGVFTEGITRSGVRLERWVYTVYNRRSATELRAGCHSGGDLLWQGWERTTPARQTCSYVSNKVWWQTETFNSMHRKYAEWPSSKPNYGVIQYSWKAIYARKNLVDHLKYQHCWVRNCKIVSPMVTIAYNTTLLKLNRNWYAYSHSALMIGKKIKSVSQV